MAFGKVRVAEEVTVLETKEEYSLARLVNIMAELRAEDGCPWDRKQTHKSLRPYLVEEAYEAIQAIDDMDDKALCEELGDVLLQVVFHSEVADERGKFNITHVLKGIIEKMVRRHPHVFGDAEAKDSEAVLVNWERIKQKEHAEDSIGKEVDSILGNVPKVMPALMRAIKVQSKASRVGFDWPDIEGPLSKVDEEYAELREARKAGDIDAIEEEIGDVLFALVNVSRFLKVDPEIALGKAVDKFISRFRYIEREARKNRRQLEDMTLEDMDALWEKSKEAEVL
ncbi:MAG: nucleoside triphosphate pyrophosphohydrolase [Firmicutes bacterium]|jgi:tetrapyrrole methylase family protein/MazG family protein|nr:nucleoside triphosphate pyrophosphohydrolase [Bacillota bacterium]